MLIEELHRRRRKNFKFLTLEMHFSKGNQWICDEISQKFPCGASPPHAMGGQFSKLSPHTWGDSELKTPPALQIMGGKLPPQPSGFWGGS